MEGVVLMLSVGSGATQLASSYLVRLWLRENHENK